MVDMAHRGRCWKNRYCSVIVVSCFCSDGTVILDVATAGFFRFEVDLDGESSLTLNDKWLVVKIVKMLACNRVSRSDNHPSVSSITRVGILV